MKRTVILKDDRDDCVETEVDDPLPPRILHGRTLYVREEGLLYVQKQVCEVFDTRKWQRLPQ
ncbi:hypothetical protein LCGC14_1281960 [marine sediment metagenome]|uniref:Uncharacterized protein n=1 Tax=marine sediment metagenome TaxID=412755 RepID=A0A0F9LFZ9_9ZZZZ